MNELTRLAYLRAMGTDSYLSRRQLPGAAPTRRLAIVRGSQAVADSTLSAPAADDNVKGLLSATLGDIARAPQAGDADPAPTARSPQANTEVQAPRFSLAATLLGGWLWLEELEDVAFTAQQVQLLQAIAHALGLIPAGGSSDDTRPRVAQFDWPIHRNHQLDLGEQAARASAAGFLQRKLEQDNCQGMVLLGEACAGRVAMDRLECDRVVTTVSTRQMLTEPVSKRRAWSDLRPILGQV